MKTLNQFLDESTGGGVPLTPQELEIQKKMSRLNVRLARKRSQQMQKAKVDDTETAPEQVKESSTVLDANKKLEKEKKTKKDKAELAKLTHIYKGMKKGIYNSYEPEGEMVEAKVDDVKYSKDEKRKNYETDVHTLSVNKGVRTDRNKRHSATDVAFKGHGATHRDRMQKHYKSRGVKTKGMKEEVVTERLGGKGYKARTDSRGIKVSGDWEDSDRGAGNKAKKRAGGKVEKKSPTYQAHVLNKEGVGRAAIGAALGSVAGPVGAAAGAAIGASLGKKKVTSGSGGKKKPKNFFKAEPKVTTSEDKAFNYVVAKLKKQHGDGVLTKGDKMPQPSAAQKKKNAAIRAKRAKEDHRDPTEKASDGRYSDRHSNRGSD